MNTRKPSLSPTERAFRARLSTLLADLACPIPPALAAALEEHLYRVDGQGQVVRRAVIVHGCTKEGKVDARDVKLAVARRGKFVSDRVGHTFMPGTSEADE